MASDENTSNGSGNGADDAPLIDLNEASIRKLIAKAKRKGYITVDELNAALPEDDCERLLQQGRTLSLFEADHLIGFVTPERNRLRL